MSRYLRPLEHDVDVDAVRHRQLGWRHAWVMAFGLDLGLQLSALGRHLGSRGSGFGTVV
jgi:hypothetical protein